MPVTTTYPGVYIEELPSPVHTIAGVATSIAAFVGYTASGIDNRAELLFSFSDYERLFGGLASDSELSYAVQQFFSNGGSQAYVVRAPKIGASGANVSFDGMTFTALSSGSWADNNLIIDVDFTNIDPTVDAKAFNLTITNLVDGTTESFPRVTLTTAKKNYIAAIVNDPDTGSQLVNVVVTGSPGAPTATGLVGATNAANFLYAAMGSKTAVNGTVSITVAAPTVVVGATSIFTTVLKPGQLVMIGNDTTAYEIASIASDTSLTLKTAYGGTLPVVAGTTMSVVVPTPTADKDYNLIMTVTNPTPVPAPLPLTIRVFNKGAPVPQSMAGLTAQVQRAINNALGVSWPGASVQVTPSGSALRVNAFFPGANIDAVLSFSLVTTTTSLGDAAGALGLRAPTSSNVAHYALGTGHGWAQQTNSVAGGDGTGLPGTAQLVGNQMSFTGIYALDKIDLFNLLCIPDATRAGLGTPSTIDSTVDPVVIYSSAISYCKTRRAMLLIDCPPNVNDVNSALDWKTTTIGVHDENGACFFPRLRLADPLDGYQLRTYAPCGVIAGLYARIDASRGVWKAPAGTESTLTGVQGVVYKLNDAENGVLNPVAVNCTRLFPVYGPVLWGARTLVGADVEGSQWKYVPVRRLALYIEESLYRGTQWAVFEPNDEPLWSALRLNVGSFMHDLFRKGAFQGQTPTEAYLVKCDSETTTQNDIDQGRVNILVAFAPLKPAEFVVIQIQQLAGQVQT